MIVQLTQQLTEAEAHHTKVQGVAASYRRQLEEAMVDMCNGDTRALQVKKCTVSSQRQIIWQQRHS